MKHNFNAANYMSNPYIEKKQTVASRVDNNEGDKGSVASENIAEQGQRRRRSDRASASQGSQISQHSKKSPKRSRLDRAKIKQNMNARIVKKPIVIRESIVGGGSIPHANSTLSFNRKSDSNYRNNYLTHKKMPSMGTT